MDVFDIDYVNYKLKESGYTGSAFHDVDELAIRFVSAIRENLNNQIEMNKTKGELLEEVEEKYKAYGLRHDYVAVEELRKMTIEDFIDRFYQEGP